MTDVERIRAAWEAELVAAQGSPTAWSAFLARQLVRDNGSFTQNLILLAYREKIGVPNDFLAIDEAKFAQVVEKAATLAGIYKAHVLATLPPAMVP